MLKPRVHVICEKVIFSQTLVASVINMFAKLTINLAREAPEVPADAVAPKEWAVFSSWDTESGDELKEYFFCMEIFYPDHSQFGDTSRVRINVEPNKSAQVGVQLVALPIGQVGFYTVKTWVEENHHVVVDPMELKFEVEIARVQA